MKYLRRKLKPFFLGLNNTFNITLVAITIFGMSSFVIAAGEKIRLNDTIYQRIDTVNYEVGRIHDRTMLSCQLTIGNKTWVAIIRVQDLTKRSFDEAFTKALTMASMDTTQSK